MMMKLVTDKTDMKQTRQAHVECGWTRSSNRFGCRDIDRTVCCSSQSSVVVLSLSDEYLGSTRLNE